MFDIIASDAAKGDLEEIKTYLLTEFRNPQVDESEKLVKVHRFFHGLQNWALHL